MRPESRNNEGRWIWKQNTNARDRFPQELATFHVFKWLLTPDVEADITSWTSKLVKSHGKTSDEGKGPDKKKKEKKAAASTAALDASVLALFANK